MTDEDQLQTQLEILRKHRSKRSEVEVKTLVSTLSRSTFFTELDETAKFQICKNLKLEKFPANATVVREGDSATKFWLILSGAVNVLIKEKEVDTKEVDAEMNPASPLSAPNRRKSMAPSRTVRLEEPVTELEHTEKLARKVGVRISSNEESDEDSDSDDDDDHDDDEEATTSTAMTSQVNARHSSPGVQERVEELQRGRRSSVDSTMTRIATLFAASDENQFAESRMSISGRKKSMFGRFVDAKAAVVRPPKVIKVASLRSGDTFGEYALLMDTPYNTSVQTQEATIFATVTAAAYHTTLDDINTARMEVRSCFMKSLPLFSAFAQQHITRIAALLCSRIVVRSERLLDFGSQPVEVLLLREGDFSLWCQPKSSEEGETAVGRCGTSAGINEGRSGRSPSMLQPTPALVSEEGNVRNLIETKRRVKPIMVAVLGPNAVIGLAGILKGDRQSACQRQVVCQSSVGAVYSILARELVPLISKDQRKQLLTALEAEEAFLAERIIVLSKLQEAKAEQLKKSSRRWQTDGSFTGRLDKVRSNIDLIYAKNALSVYSAFGRLQLLGSTQEMSPDSRGENDIQPRKDTHNVECSSLFPPHLQLEIFHSLTEERPDTTMHRPRPPPAATHRLRGEVSDSFGDTPISSPSFRRHKESAASKVSSRNSSRKRGKKSRGFINDKEKLFDSNLEDLCLVAPAKEFRLHSAEQEEGHLKFEQDDNDGAQEGLELLTDPFEFFSNDLRSQLPLDDIETSTFKPQQLETTLRCPLMNSRLSTAANAGTARPWTAPEKTASTPYTACPSSFLDGASNNVFNLSFTAPLTTRNNRLVKLNEIYQKCERVTTADKFARPRLRKSPSSGGRMFHKT